MNLSRLYSNQRVLFEPIDFVKGLNVVLAEIRLPDNREKDTHNLGKSTLVSLLDFCFISKRSKEFFLFKHYDQFKDFVFFLEIRLDEASYVTVCRSVENASKVSFKKHEAGHQDFSSLPNSAWDHYNIPFERARLMLDGFLDFRSLEPWSYRNFLDYQLRSQDDFSDVFHLHSFVGKHKDWKPFLAHILGFNAQLLTLHYEQEDLVEETIAKINTIESELGGSVEDISKIEGLLLLKQNETNKKQALLDAFDFRSQDKDCTEQLINEIDKEIAELNARRYMLNYNKKKIVTSLEEDQILFNPAEAEKLFREVGVLFANDIKRDFEQLIAFNRAISEERRGYLQEELKEIEAELGIINPKLDNLGTNRSNKLAFLSSTDIFDKYKEDSNKMVTLRADITSLERQRDLLRNLQKLRTDLRTLTVKRDHLQTEIETDVENQNAEESSLFSSIRLFFNEIIENVIDHKALLSVSPNKKGHLEFKAEILDESGNATSADLGHTYRKLLCIAFDLAVMRAHLHEKFPRFVFHDGLLESLDDRKKENLLVVIRNYTGLGIQSIITLIDSDLPSRKGSDTPVFDAEEIILKLHDEGNDGRLFKMDPW
jgi:uncharacterized protein YydD (DUF2326 family)